MGRKILLGFAGPAEVSKNNVKDLLADYLDFGPEDKDGLPTFAPDVDEIRVVVPVSEEYLETPTVKLLVEWTEYADLPMEVLYQRETDQNAEILDRLGKHDTASKVRNVSYELVERLVEADKNGEEARLIVAYGEGDDAVEKLVDLAQGKSIKVLDLTAGLDDLHLGDDPQDEPEPEPEKATRRGRRTAKEAEPEAETEQEKPRRRRGTPRKAAETPPEPAGDVEEESVEAEAAHARQKAQKAAEATPEPEGDLIMRALQDSRWLVQSLDSAHAAMTGREEPVHSELARRLERAIDEYGKLRQTTFVGDTSPEDVSPKGGRPRSDGSPARRRTPAQRSKKEWQDADGVWHPAGRGRIPRDVPVRTVDPKTGDVIED